MEIGDIVLIRKKPSWFFGRFNHCGIYIGTRKHYRTAYGDREFWDRDECRYINDKFTKIIIHSAAKSNSGSGLGFSTLKNFTKNSEETEIIYVKKAKMNDIEKIPQFLFDQLEFRSGRPCGPHYDRGWLLKQTTVYKRNPLSLRKGYYCSEMVWGAYKEICGIDLDKGFDLKTLWGVSPDDLFESSHTAIL